MGGCWSHRICFDSRHHIMSASFLTACQCLPTLDTICQESGRRGIELKNTRKPIAESFINRDSNGHQPGKRRAAEKEEQSPQTISLRPTPSHQPYVWMYVCMQEYMYACIQMYVCVYTYLIICIYIYMHNCTCLMPMHIIMYVYIQGCMALYAHVFCIGMYVGMHVCVNACKCVCMCVRIHIIIIMTTIYIAL